MEARMIDTTTSSYHIEKKGDVNLFKKFVHEANMEFDYEVNTVTLDSKEDPDTNSVYLIDNSSHGANFSILILISFRSCAVQYFLGR